MFVVGHLHMQMHMSMVSVALLLVGHACIAEAYAGEMLALGLKRWGLWGQGVVGGQGEGFQESRGEA